MALDTIVIVGGSLSGLTAAQVLREEGFDASLVVIDSDPDAGYDRPPLSKQVLTGDWDVSRTRLPVADADLGIDWFRGKRATGLDLTERVVQLDGGDPIGYDGLIIATGATPRRLPGMEGIAGVHLLRTLADASAIRAELDAGATRVVVVGSGFIGSEVAASCRKRGCDVVVLEALEVPLERAVGAQVGSLIADIHREEGVDLRLGVGVDSFVTGADGRVDGVVLSNGEQVPADLVVVGIGVSPSTGWLDGSGLQIDNGVVVQETLLAAPAVVAVGDIARWPSRRYGQLMRMEHWENAIQMGEHGARTLLGEARDEPIEVYDPIPYFWCDMYSHKLQLAGNARADDTFEVVIGSTGERRFVGLYGRAGRLVGVLGIHRPRQVMQLRQKLIEGVSFAEAVEFAHSL